MESNDIKEYENNKTLQSTYLKNQFPIYHQYKSSGEKIIRMSSNLSSLGVIGPLVSKNTATDQLVSADLNVKISDIAPSCFAECKNLVHIGAGNNVKAIGDYAFYNCENLSSINFLASDNKVLTRIGDYAFAGSGLKSIKLNLQGSIADSSVNTHCFANCKQLSSVEMINSTYLGDHMFDGCDKLVKVKLNDYHSYVNSYAFANCRTLAKIEIPANIYMLSPHMFEGCVNLTSVQFQSGAQLRQLGECVFSGCTKLKSITLPKSVNNLDYIDPLFLSGSSIQKVEFKGLSDDVFINETYKKIDIEFFPHTWYSSPKSTVEKLINACHEKHLPMIINLGNHRGCGHCANWEDNVTKNDTWETWFNNCQYFFIHGIYGNDYQAYSYAKKFISQKTGLAVPGGFPMVYVYWNRLNDDGTETIVADGSSGRADGDRVFGTTAGLIQKATETFAGYEGISSITEEIKSEITTFGLGPGKKITYVSSTGKEYECSNDKIEYKPEVKVDKTTTTNFKFGTWYRNAKQLIAAADVAGVPVLAEFGSIGCDPCIDFRRNTFNNQTFQDTITSLPVLLCKVEIEEGESFDYPPTSQAHWISHSFGDPKTYIPQLIFYWNPPESISGSKPYKEIWNYNYRSDAANANYQTVLNKVDMMLNHFRGGKEWLATISSSFEGQPIYSNDIGRYRYYNNEIGDDDGRYFVCDSKTRIQTWNSAVLSIKNEDHLSQMGPLDSFDQLCGVIDPTLQDFQLFSSAVPTDFETTYITNGEYSIFTSISEYDIVEIEKATYQCFTAPINSPTSNLSGVIIKVSEIDAVNNKAVIRDGTVWKYAIDEREVAPEDISKIERKNGVEYLYMFLNTEDDIPDLPKDDDWPLGTWINASEVTSRESFEDIYKDSENESTVLVIVEDFKTNMAIATLEDGTTDSIRVSLDNVNINDVEKIVKEAFKQAGKTVTSVNNLSELKIAASFKMIISENTTFRNWMARSGYRFILVRTDDWNKGFPQALRYFEEEVEFEGNTPSDSLPKILVYHGCSTCVVSGVALYCRKKIAVDQVRTDPTYYTGLIDSYAKLDDEYIWYR